MRTALVVEDDPGFEGVLLDSIRHLGPEWQAKPLRLAQAAIDYVESRNSPVDMALVDLGLPDRHGTDVIRSIRRHYTDVPILVVSVLAAEAAVVDAIKAGASGYILKDDNSLSIGNALNQVKDGIYPISPALARFLFKLAQDPKQDSRETNLSEKEMEVLRNISRGHSYADVAKMMGISLSTVQTHIRHLYRKLGANSGVQAVTKAKETGLL
jgi:DNA-binding NarL/FixJ family response regulator